MFKIDSRIDIRVSSTDKKKITEFCKKNNIKLSDLLRKCVLNYIRECELKENK